MGAPGDAQRARRGTTRTLRLASELGHRDASLYLTAAEWAYWVSVTIGYTTTTGQQHSVTVVLASGPSA